MNHPGPWRHPRLPPCRLPCTSHPHSINHHNASTVRLVALSSPCRLYVNIITLTCRRCPTTRLPRFPAYPPSSFFLCAASLPCCVPLADCALLPLFASPKRTLLPNCNPLYCPPPRHFTLPPPLPLSYFCPTLGLSQSTASPRSCTCVACTRISTRTCCDALHTLIHAPPFTFAPAPLSSPSPCSRVARKRNQAVPACLLSLPPPAPHGLAALYRPCCHTPTNCSRFWKCWAAWRNRPWPSRAAGCPKHAVPAMAAPSEASGGCGEGLRLNASPALPFITA